MLFKIDNRTNTLFQLTQLAGTSNMKSVMVDSSLQVKSEIKKSLCYGFWTTDLILKYFFFGNTYNVHHKNICNTPVSEIKLTNHWVNGVVIKTCPLTLKREATLPCLASFFTPLLQKEV